MARVEINTENGMWGYREKTSQVKMAILHDFLSKLEVMYMMGGGSDEC